MQKAFTFRQSFRRGSSSGRGCRSLAPVRAHAASKDIIELQTQVQQLLDMVQRLQSTLDTRFGVLQHLVEQTADNANQMTATVNALQQKLNAQNEALGGKVDTASGQVQSLNDSVDELKTRIAKLDKSIAGSAGPVAEYPERSARRAQPARARCPGARPMRRRSGPGGGSPGQPVPSGASRRCHELLRCTETFQAGLRDLQRRQVHRSLRRVSGCDPLLSDG